MTADIINLKRARKNKQRDAAQDQAQQNRVSFGRRKDEKRATMAHQVQADHKLDQHKRQPDRVEEP